MGPKKKAGGKKKKVTIDEFDLKAYNISQRDAIA